MTSTTQLKISCTHCSTIQLRQYKWMDPAEFKDPSNAILTSFFNCIKCKRKLAVKMAFLPENKIEHREDLIYREEVKDEPTPFYIGGKMQDDIPIERIAANLAFNLVNDTVEE